MAKGYEWLETDVFRIAGSQTVRCFANAPRLFLMAAGGEEGTITLWRVKRSRENLYPGIEETLTPQYITDWKAHQKAVTSLAFHADRQLLISGSADGILKFWPAAGGAAVQEVNLRVPIHAIRAFPTQNAIVVGTADTVVQILEIPTGKQLARFQVPSHAGHGDVSVFSDERFIAGGCRDGFTCVWGVQSGKLIQKVEGAVCAFRPGTNVLVTTNNYDYNDKLCVWELQQKWFRITAEQKELHQFQMEKTLALAFSPDGRFLAVLTDEISNRNIHIFPPRDWTVMQVLSVPEEVTALHFGVGQHEILAGTATGVIFVWQCV